MEQHTSKKRRVAQPSPYALAEGIEWWSCVMRQWKAKHTTGKQALMPVQVTIATQSFFRPLGMATSSVRIKHLYFATLRDAYEYAAAAMIGNAWAQLCALRRAVNDACGSVADDGFRSSLNWFRNLEAEFRTNIPATADGSDGWRRRFDAAHLAVHLFVGDVDTRWQSDAQLRIMNNTISVVVISRDMLDQNERFARKTPEHYDDVLPEWYSNGGEASPFSVNQ
jgi:hypothetical protein